MKEYLVSVMGVCVLCFIVKQVSFESQKKYISFICGLCAVAVIASPIGNAIEWLSELRMEKYIEDDTYSSEELEDVFESYLKDRHLDEIKEIIKSDVCEKYLLDLSEVEIFLGIVGDELEKITLRLVGKGVFANSNDMKEYLQERYLCNVEIIIGG